MSPIPYIHIILELTGSALIVYGASLLHPGLGWIAAGILVLIWGYVLLSKDAPSEQDKRFDDMQKHVTEHITQGRLHRD